MNVQFIPIWLPECPDFMACLVALNATLAPLRGHHGYHSVLMVWE